MDSAEQAVTTSFSKKIGRSTKPSVGFIDFV